MKGKIAILIGAALFLVVAAGCSASADGVYHPEPPCNAECEARRQADREYYAENYPTREDSLRIRECVTERTGYESSLFCQLWPSQIARIEEDTGGEDAGGSEKTLQGEFALLTSVLKTVLPAVGKQNFRPSNS